MVRESQPTGSISVATAALRRQHVRYSSMGHVVDLHPNWLRDHTQEPGHVEQTNRQRLFTPRDLDADLAATSCVVDGEHLIVGFSDGHVARLPTDLIERRLGWMFDEEEPPAPEPWTAPLDPFPYIDWGDIGSSIDEENTDSVIEFLSAFFRHGYVVLRDTPTAEGALRSIAGRLGYLVGQNFGEIFDVRAKPDPTDLAYTTIELLAHSDLPYRQPVPGIQLLHCLRNEAPGGDSTLVDGLAAAEALLAERPELHAALVATAVEYRYDMGSDTVVNRGHILEYDRHGRYRQIRFNTKLDSPILRPEIELDSYYAGRRWLTDWLNDPTHQVTFRLEPGDVMLMDNHRALHGRTAFDSSAGYRHLQGCYIEHDGLDTMYRLAVRRRRVSMCE